MNLVSSSGLRAHDRKRKGQRILFVFRFQVKVSVFLLGTEINDDSNCHPMFQKGVFQCSRGRDSEKRSWGQAPRLLPFLYNCPVLFIAVVGLRASIFKSVRDFWQIGEIISSVNYILNKCKLVSIK